MLYIFTKLEMPMLKKLFIFYGPILMLCLAGCNLFGGKISNDPFTGGVNISTSNLLDIPLPAGLQIYPSHGFIQNINGAKQGLETLRGYINLQDTARSLFNTLKANGWQLRAACRKGEKAFYLYQKAGEYCAITFRPQGALLILEIWRGQTLPEDAQPTFAPYPALEEEGHNSIAPEEYGALTPGAKDETSPAENWGNSGQLEEREL